MIRSLIGSKTFGFIALVAIVTMIPLTVMSLQEQKDTRQHAAEIPVISPSPTPTPAV